MSLQNENFHNLIYATIQVVHNFGAVATLGGYLGLMVFKPGMLKTANISKKVVLIILGGWGIQGLSGAAFGMTSLLFYQRFPEIGKIGSVMLAIKIFCVAIGFTMIGIYVLWGTNWKENKKNSILVVSSALAVIALTAAAFLRWFS